MPTHEYGNGLAGDLQSSESWSRQQALHMLRLNLSQTLNSLTPTQQRDYLRLQRQALQALKAVDAKNQQIIDTFKTDGLARLRARLGGLDPEQIHLHTRYLEALNPPLPWEPRTGSDESMQRFRRSYDDWKFRAHVSSLTLWEAACLNFDFATRHKQKSGHSFIDASYLTGVDAKQLNVERFVAISRELNLGAQLQVTLTEALAEGGSLQTLLHASAKACLLFDALEAYRNRASTGVTLQRYEQLIQAIDGSGPALAFDTLGMSTGITLLPAVPFVPSGTTVPVPLIVIKVASLGVLSYFPSRPGGALRYHADASSAAAHFNQQLKSSHGKNDLGWFSRQLPLVNMREFKQLLSDEPRPVGLSPVAGFMYDTFHTLFPERTLDSLRFTPDPKHGRSETLLQALTYRQVQRYQANLSALATDRAERDLQVVIDGAAAMAGEVMELLLTPMPGGVFGLNRIMQVAVFGNLAYSAIVGVNEAARGQANDFAAAMADVADLAINGLLISTAGRVHRQRMQSLLQRLGNPRKVTLADGSDALWKPEIGPYALLDQNLLKGQVANPQGVYTLNGKQYAWLKHGSRQQVVEIRHDAQQLRMVLAHDNGSSYAPPIIYDPAQQAWTLDVHNAHTLSDVQLIERMLPNGTTAVPREAVEKFLRSTAPTRATLDQVWAGHPAPVTLTEGVRRLQVDQVLSQLISDFHRRGQLPPHADSAVLCLLTQLPDWPATAMIQVHDEQGRLSETFAASDTATHAINLKRRDDGTYTALTDAATGPATQEQVLELILRQQPADSTLGREGSPGLTETQRIARLRLHISESAKARRIELFEAMTRYHGYARHELAVDNPARALLPVKVITPWVEVTPVLKKLREAYPPLTAANLAHLLQAMPLDGAARTTFLKDASLPPPLAQHLEHHRTALRIDAVIDGLYHPRAFNLDTDQWAREFASSLVRNTLKRHFVVTEVVNGQAQGRHVSSGPDDTTVELMHYGQGRYEAYDQRNAGTIPVSPTIDSFYLAIGSVLQPHERQQLGMQSASDALGLRKTLGDLMSTQRSPEGYVSLLDLSLAQYEQKQVLPADLQPSPEGIYEWDGQQLLALYGSLYPITYDNQLRKWRLKHPRKIGVDTPRLEHNGHGAWRLNSENPMGWDDYHLFYRLGPGDFHVDQPTATRILGITDTPARALREVHRAGHAPPPLLQDTSKRFRIERELTHFIQAMTTYSATRNARPSLQLQLACASPQWPASHVLVVVDERGRQLWQRPVDAAPTARKVVLTEAQSRGPDPLYHLIRDDDLARALLGELPTGHEERLFKLAKKVAEHAQRERSQLFDSLYTQSERNGTPLQRRFKQHYPDLPSSATNAILDKASPRELKQLREHDRVGLRLAEQARLTANDVRLNRAFEGLYLTTPTNPDTDKIVAHLLKSVPGWPSALRLDIHDGRLHGPLLQSAGHLAGSERRSLVRVDGGYQAYDSQGQLLGNADAIDLFSALSRQLSPSQRKAMGFADDGNPAALRTTLAALALNQRPAIKALLNLPHIPHWLQPPMRVDSSFSAWPFSLRSLWPFSRNQPVDLVSKTQEIYPSFSVADANDFIAALGMSEPAALIELERRKAEYQALDFGLTRWVEAPNPNDHIPENLALRRELAQQLRRAWRRETRAVYVDGLFNAHHLALDLEGNDLPDADFILGTRGFEHIAGLRLNGEVFPATGNAFLAKFANLKFLKIDCMLQELPAEITEMKQLEHLRLDDNDITLTEESRTRLAGMTRLRQLHLDDNPNLALTPDVSQMPLLRTLSLQNTGIRQWPIGAEHNTRLRALLLQGNQITEVPEAIFTNPGMRTAFFNTVLHDNPLNQASRDRIDTLHARFQAQLHATLDHAHRQPADNDFAQWLTGVPAHHHRALETLWGHLKQHPGASPDDAFQVLRDLTQSYPYRKDAASREALTERVWVLLEAMGQSTELREKVFLNTYVAGTCGDGALLVFIDMEIEHLRYQAKAQPSSNQANRELLALGQSLFYLRKIDQLAEDHLSALRAQEIEPDDAEVKLYLRLTFANEFNLPVQREEMLYSVEDWITAQDIDHIRRTLQALSTTDAPMDSLLSEDFWIEYLANNYPEPFTTIDQTISHKVNALKQEIPDTRSDTYLERRQSLVDLETAERNRLINQLTRAAQSGAQRNEP